MTLLMSSEQLQIQLLSDHITLLTKFYGTSGLFSIMFARHIVHSGADDSAIFAIMQKLYKSVNDIELVCLLAKKGKRELIKKLLYARLCPMTEKEYRDRAFKTYTRFTPEALKILSFYL